MNTQKGLKHGLYRIYWTGVEGGGSSLAAIGYTHDGTNWFACCNWTSPDNSKPIVASTDWSKVEWIELIEAVNYNKEESTDPETPTNTVAPPVSEEGIEAAARLAAREMYGTDINSFGGQRDGFVEGAKWGANSVRQQGDDYRNFPVGSAEGIYNKLVEVYGAIQEERISKGVEHITWVEKYLKEAFEYVSAKSWNPAIPQPGFIEILRAANPFDHRNEDQAKFYQCDGWNQCCNHATELLGGKGEEGK